METGLHVHYERAKRLGHGKAMACIFFSYSHRDEPFRDELEKHLSVLKREGKVQVWYDRKLAVGTEIDSAIAHEIDKADIIFLLVSSDFLASDYCWGIEMRRALERHETGSATVIPIILRPCEWHRSPFGNLLAAPTDGKPVVSWADRDEAFLNVVKHVREALTSNVDLFTGSKGQASSRNLVPADIPGRDSAAQATEREIGSVIMPNRKGDYRVLMVQANNDWIIPTRPATPEAAPEHTAKRAAEARVGKVATVIRELHSVTHLPAEWELTMARGTFGEDVIEASWRFPIAVLLEGQDSASARPLLRASRRAVGDRRGALRFGQLPLEEHQQIEGVASYSETPVLFVFSNGVAIEKLDGKVSETEAYEVLMAAPSLYRPHPLLAPNVETTYFLVRTDFNSAESINAERRGAPVRWFTLDEVIEARLRDWDVDAIIRTTEFLLEEKS